MGAHFEERTRWIARDGIHCGTDLYLTQFEHMLNMGLDPMLSLTTEQDIELGRIVGKPETIAHHLRRVSCCELQQSAGKPH